MEGMTIFLGKFSTLQCRNTSSWNPSIFQNFCGIENYSALKEGILLFPSKLSVSQYRNTMSGRTSVLQKTSGKGKNWMREGRIPRVSGEFFSHSTENFVGGTLVFRKCSDIEIFLVIRSIKILSRIFCMLVL